MVRTWLSQGWTTSAFASCDPPIGWTHVSYVPRRWERWGWSLVLTSYICEQTARYGGWADESVTFSRERSPLAHSAMLCRDRTSHES
eukprot:733924-Prymnesium_polylepis.1